MSKQWVVPLSFRIGYVIVVLWVSKGMGIVPWVWYNGIHEGKVHVLEQAMGGSPKL